MSRARKRGIILIGIGVFVWAGAAVALSFVINPAASTFISGVAGLISGIIANVVLPKPGEDPTDAGMQLIVVKGPAVPPPFRLRLRPYTIGRNGGADLVFRRDRKMSSQHALLEPVAGQWSIRDLGSYNGTFVDYEKITQRTMVIPGQVVQIGRTRFVLREGPPFL